MRNVRTLLRLAQAAFWCALMFSFVSAVMPASEAPHFFPWDKASHVCAFYVLTFLAIAAFPLSELPWIGIGLSAFGALIEVVQGLPFVHRDKDFWDWVADTIAILSVIGPVLLASWRSHVQSAAVDGVANGKRRSR